jgi:hypothetical protein
VSGASPRSDFRRVFGVPLVIAAISVFGLLSALFGDGAWDAASWFALGVPLAVIAWHVVRARPRG